ncbi:dihydropteroate synthase [Aporhodopirellula aestuarii]|uniref:Dihydropteroate synthase n=1 Tax=Aporhodopirellula aestuarii TaxID=2950107 RepID=A0ABT0TXR8_9BACT|nr:dihydropteroate synthase [Aporhodopirellula aestuarii]MCM2369379.1 dihydropteroate synthase [Aporhodopirellula aestuarii]
MSSPLVWKTSRRTITIGDRPRVMGILNVTPDSFSDGGRFYDQESDDDQPRINAAVSAGLQMQADGADIIDIGGESTRPYSTPVDAATESARVVPVIEKLAQQLTIPISIDSSKAIVAEAAISAGAEIVNDITGLEGDPEMADLVKRTGVGVCVMHMQGTPQTMQDAPTYQNVVEEIRDYLIARRDACLASGIEQANICLDPGIGFGKTHAHNLELVRGIPRFIDLGCVCLIGHSRKGFIRKQLASLAEASAAGTSSHQFNPLAGTLAVSLAAAAAGAHLLRVHDVAETTQALEMFQACGAIPRQS